MSDADRVAARIVGRLTSAQAPLRAELAEILVDQLFERRVRDVVDLAGVHGLLLQLFSSANLRRIVEEHVAPGFARYAADREGQSARVGSLVDPVAHQKLHALVRNFRVPDAKWAEHGLDPALLRRLFGPVWTQVLQTFAKRLPMPLGAASAPAADGGRNASAGLTGVLTRSVQAQAEKLIDRGRSVMGGLGAEVERRLSVAARDFSDTAAHAFRQSMQERLRSDEGRELVSQILAGFTDHVLRTRFAELQLDVDVLPVAELFDLVPELVSHAARSAFVQGIVQRETETWLTAQGERRLGELLDEYECRAAVRTLIASQIDRLAAHVFEAPAFSDWLQRLLQPDGSE